MVTDCNSNSDCSKFSKLIQIKSIISNKNIIK